MSRPSNRSGYATPGAALTGREIQVLALVAAGESSLAIAQRLGIAQSTVKSHLTRVYLKIDARNRVQATRYYLRHYTLSDVGTTQPPSRSPSQPAGDPSLIHTQMLEIQHRLEQLAPAATEAERLLHALNALRAIADD